MIKCLIKIKRIFIYLKIEISCLKIILLNISKNLQTKTENLNKVNKRLRNNIVEFTLFISNMALDLLNFIKIWYGVKIKIKTS